MSLTAIEAASRTPVTLLTGFLGSGKTTVLNHVLKQPEMAATAVIVNPTHFAVAIRYHMDSQAAPMVVAKGKNYLALRIKQKAMDHTIPIIENPPLARD